MSTVVLEGRAQTKTVFRCPDEGFLFILLSSLSPQFCPSPLWLQLSPLYWMRTSDVRTTLSHLVVSNSFLFRKHRQGGFTHKNMVRTSALPPLGYYPHVWTRRQCSRFSCCDNGSFLPRGAQMRLYLDKRLVFFCFHFVFNIVAPVLLGGPNCSRSK